MKSISKNKWCVIILAMVIAICMIPATMAVWATDRADGDVSLTFDDAADLNEFIEDAADANQNGSFTVEDGKLKLTKGEGWGQYALRLGYASMQTFTASMDISLDTATLTADGDVCIGFATRLTAGTAWTAKTIDVTLSAAASRPYVGKMVTRGDPSYAEYDSFSSTADYAKVNYTVIGEGTSITAYLDGVKILQNVKDGVAATTLNSGDVALIWYGSAGATFYVDNFSIKDEAVVPGTSEEPGDPNISDRADGDVSLTFDDAADLDEFIGDAADGNSGITAVVENGELKLTKEEGWGQYALRLGYTSMQAFTASMEIKIEGDTLTKDKDICIGFATRLTAGTSWTVKNIDAGMSAASSRRYMVNLVSRGDGLAYDPLANVLTDIGYDSTVKLTVIGDGTSVKVYVDDLLMAENIKAGQTQTSTTFDSGDIAVLIYGESAVTAYVDNLVITDDATEPEEPGPEYELKDEMNLTFGDAADLSDFVKNSRDGGAEGSLTVANGELCLSFIKGNSDAQYAAWRLGNAGEKFTLTIDVAMEKGLLGVFVRTANNKPWSQEGVMLQDNVDSGGAFALVGYPAGTIYGGDKDGNVVYLGDAVKQYIQVKIIGDGNKITVMIGNEYAKTLENSEGGVTDPTTALTGEIGFLLYNPMGDAVAYLDNLTLVAEADYTPPVILGAIEDDEDDKDDGNTNGNNTGKDDVETGCGGSMAAALPFAVAAGVLGAICVILFRKKKKQ